MRPLGHLLVYAGTALMLVAVAWLIFDNPAVGLLAAGVAVWAAGGHHISTADDRETALLYRIAELDAEVQALAGRLDAVRQRERLKETRR